VFLDHKLQFFWYVIGLKEHWQQEYNKSEPCSEATSPKSERPLPVAVSLSPQNSFFFLDLLTIVHDFLNNVSGCWLSLFHYFCVF
jgi:hypothetical protein